MTPISLVVRRARGPIASAAVTAMIFAAAVWVQRTRSAWPFTPSPVTPRGAASAGLPAHDEDAPAHDRAPVDAAAAGALDLRLETVGRQPLTQTIRAVATVVPDESRIAHVHTRVAGWIEHLDVGTTGELVRAGQPVARIFSQELLASQTEYLAARRALAASGITSAVVASGRARLGVLGMSSAEIDAIEAGGEPRRLVTVVAPHGGVVVSRGVTTGAAVEPGTTLVTIADLSRVWVIAEVPEADIPAIRVGAPARLEFAASGRPPFPARVALLSPTLTERTRTLRARFSVSNPRGVLRPGLYGTAEFQAAGEPVITVPRDALVDTGDRQHVFVAVDGRFEPRPVAVGARLADRVEIRDGLREGEQIVVSGVFLLDSESRLRATGAGGGGHAHGAAPAAAAPAAAAPPAGPDPHAGHR
jgi:Cu(I)/Ag(I) efflux system membrane fusion protein